MYGKEKKFKKKKVAGSILTFGTLMFFSFNAYAASSTAVVSSSDSDHSGSQVWCGDNIMDLFWAENDSYINYYAYIMQEVTGINKSVHTRTIGDYQQVESQDIYINEDDHYYARAKWTGEAGLKYLQGRAGIISE